MEKRCVDKGVNEGIRRPAEEKGEHLVVNPTELQEPTCRMKQAVLHSKNEVEVEVMGEDRMLM